jgi:predicted phage-related endonuclease
MTKIGELITPTGRLVLPAARLGGEEWLQARRWRHPKDVLPGRINEMPLMMDTDHPLYRYGYRIGSSDVPSILDLEHVDTPAHVYRAKVYDIRPVPNEAMNKGHIFEEPIALEWCRRNHAVIREIGLVAKDGAPWRQTTIDREVRECPVYPERSRDRAICGLEVKKMEFQSASRWHVDLPDRIMAQIADQLAVTGYEHMHYMVDVPGTFRQGIVYADREANLIDYVYKRVEQFRNEHLLAGVEPEWDVSEKPDKMIALDEATHPDRVGELDIKGIGEVMAYAQASRNASDAEAERKRQAARLRQLADGKEFVKFADEPAFRLGITTRTNVDLDKLKEKYPDAYADPEVVSETRSHTIYIDKAYKIKKGEA